MLDEFLGNFQLHFLQAKKHKVNIEVQKCKAF